MPSTLWWWSPRATRPDWRHTNDDHSARPTSARGPSRERGRAASLWPMGMDHFRTQGRSPREPRHLLLCRSPPTRLGDGAGRAMARLSVAVASAMAAPRAPRMDRRRSADRPQFCVGMARHGDRALTDVGAARAHHAGPTLGRRPSDSRHTACTPASHANGRSARSLPRAPSSVRAGPSASCPPVPCCACTGGRSPDNPPCPLDTADGRRSPVTRSASRPRGGVNVGRLNARMRPWLRPTVYGPNRVFAK